MGEIYRARDTRLERTVAIKILVSTCLRAQFCSPAFSKIASEQFG
jgi:hypothetical protein